MLICFQKILRRKNMNLKKVVKILNKVFKGWGIDFNVDIKRLNNGVQKVEATADLTLKGHDDDIYACFSFYENGMCEYLFTFDKLEKNIETLNLLSDFNTEALWFKAYIDGEYLRLSNVAFNMKEDIVETYTDRVLEKMADDLVKEYLSPLTQLTVK